MSVERAVHRLRDIKAAIGDIRHILIGLSYAAMQADIRTRAAFERFLEIVSEASRGIPEDWRGTHAADIPWPKIATISNILRHAYRDVDHSVLWSIYENDLDPLEAAVDAMLAVYDLGAERPTPPRHPSA